jgi:Holliday junction resolvasome RuvABC ATP-dependent DNA helicase subunit
MEEEKLSLYINMLKKLINIGRLPHLIFVGPSGSSKTYTANMLAKETNLSFVSINAGLLSDTDDLFRAICDSVKQGENTCGKILFIDEAHSLKKKLQDVLLTVMENKDIMHDSKKYIISPFGNPNLFAVWYATTNEEKMMMPLINRCLRIATELPTDGEKVKYLMRNFYGVTTEDYTLLLNTCISYRDMVNIKNLYESTGSVKEALNLLGIVEGLFPDEFTYLNALWTNGVMSLKHIASVLCLDPETVERIEHRLIRRGLIKVTSKGRQVSDILLHSPEIKLQKV